MPSATQLVLHIGIPKTGSTALQIAFSRNRERLRQLGIHYPVAGNDVAALDGRVVAGNGVVLLPHTTAEDFDPERLRDVRREVRAAATPVVLYSSEALFRSRPERLAELVEVMRDDGVDVSVVGFVRDLAGHALSSYSQMVKRSHLTSTLGEYVSGAAGPPRYHPLLRKRLSTLLSLLGRERVTLLHYESHQRDLLGSLLREAFGIEDLSLLTRHEDRVNRSLTVDELRVMRHVNQRVSDPRTNRKVSDALSARPPMGSTAPTIGRIELGLLARRFTDEVAWVNETFFGNDVLRIDGGATVVDESSTERELTESEQLLFDQLVDSARSD